MRSQPQSMWPNGAPTPAGEQPPAAAAVRTSHRPSPSSSRTARSTAGGSSWTTPFARATDAKLPVFTALLGTEAGVVQVPHVGGYVERIQVPPNPEALRKVATQTGGTFYEAPDRGRPERRVRQPRVAPRQASRRTRRSPSPSPPVAIVLLLLGSGLSAPLVQEGPVIRVAVTMVVAGGVARGGRRAEQRCGRMQRADGLHPGRRAVGRRFPRLEAPPPARTGSSPAPRVSSGASTRARATRPSESSSPAGSAAPSTPGSQPPSHSSSAGPTSAVPPGPRATSRSSAAFRAAEDERTPTAHSGTAGRQARPADHHAHRVGARHRRDALARATLRCRPGERLLRASHSVGFYSNGAPSSRQARLRAGRAGSFAAA